jgi:hypothetical protein
MWQLSKKILDFKNYMLPNIYSYVSFSKKETSKQSFFFAIMVDEVQKFPWIVCGICLGVKRFVEFRENSESQPEC